VGYDTESLGVVLEVAWAAFFSHGALSGDSVTRAVRRTVLRLYVFRLSRVARALTPCKDTHATCHGVLYSTESNNLLFRTSSYKAVPFSVEGCVFHNLFLAEHFRHCESAVEGSAVRRKEDLNDRTQAFY
jgi:hypothetical protein